MSNDSAGRAGAAPPAWLRVDTPYAGYADAVVADLTRIAATASGRALLEAIRAGGKSVLIGRPAVLDPPNAAVRLAADGADYALLYEPSQWPNPIHPLVQNSDAMLFQLFRQALTALQGVAEPAGGPDAEEAAAVERYRSERDNNG